MALAVGLTPSIPAAASGAPIDEPVVDITETTEPRGIPGEIPLSTDPQLAAWQELQFGLFIHWGLYSELGGVWDGEPVTSGYSEQIQMWANISEEEYLEVADRFNPTAFDPQEICSLAKAAGMRYVVITSKHHDGFSMFDTATTDYDVVDATPYGADPLKVLADECRSQGLGFGVYFSLVDWHQGHAFDGSNENPIPASMEPLIEAQIRELMTNYGDISEVWFDMSSPTTEQSARFASIVRDLQPQAAINSRIWNNQGDFRTLGDNEVPSAALDGAWQTPASIYHETWGFRSWQSRTDLPGKVRDLVTGLASVRARGGNYLLNIGPRGDGSVVEFEADALRGIGQWVDRHPRAVLGADATRFGGQPWGEVTVNEHDLFLHVTRWPSDGKLRLPGLATAVDEVREDGGDELDWQMVGDDLVVTLPEVPLDDVLPVIAVGLADDLRIVPPSTRAAGPAGDWILSPAAWEKGYSYADSGRYSSTTRTVVRQSAFISSPDDARVVLKATGQAAPTSLYKVSVGDQSQILTGAQLVGSGSGELVVPGGQVVEVAITRADPTHAGEDLGLELGSVVLAPAHPVIAWPELPASIERGRETRVPVNVANLGDETVTVAVSIATPDAWAAPVSRTVSVEPGLTRQVEVAITPPPTAPSESVRLSAVVDDADALGLGAEVRVVGPNVALDRPAAQSGTAWGGEASRAVDGNTAGDYLNDNSASHTTEPSDQAWWQVDLEDVASIGEIEIWNRTDCCTERLSDYWVMVSDRPFVSSSLEAARSAEGVTALHQEGPAGRPTTVDLDGAEGRYVRIQLESHSNPLSLTEVVVRSALEPTSEPKVDVTATTRCMAGRAYVAVRVANPSEATLGITVTTPYGSRTFPTVAPDGNAYQSFATRTASVQAGEVTVTVDYETDGGTSTFDTVAAFEGLGCG
ncbi:alpha-L-fucosidase [Cellulosimicrobium arenosum]|uniref:alpha-L-fucosidase n=1 Tax=Cellulosimicrobium arenosum TaxID=2708133 RepID=A0A927G7H4_9MICO|nr:alpha-L-fucosidase [Cellulosimicrobium arenosum]